MRVAAQASPGFATRGGTAMTRVLLVYHDIDVADIEADELRRAGYEVDRCAGPIGGEPCPVLRGEPCWQVEKADVLVYDTWDASRRHGPDLVADLRRLHPDKPLVLTSSDPALERVVAKEGEATPPILHAPTRATLKSAVQGALRTPKPQSSVMARKWAARREAQAYHGPRW
jgi:DNA-binding NtrC family response regulator